MQSYGHNFYMYLVHSPTILVLYISKDRKGEKCTESTACSLITNKSEYNLKGCPGICNLQPNKHLIKVLQVCSL